MTFAEAVDEYVDREALAWRIVTFAFENLTEQEIRVFIMTVAGFSQSQQARGLGITRQAVQAKQKQLKAKIKEGCREDFSRFIG
jgi:FixJ family two-component response regulator